MKLHIKNFRSIKQLDLELAPITVLYGHNGTGKSSALYAPLTMRNIVVNPNQEVGGFFNYGFTSLGSFEEVVFDHNPNNELELGVTIETFYPSNSPEDYVGYPTKIDYGITCSNDTTGSFKIVATLTDWDGDNHTMFSSIRAVTFPYRLDDIDDYEVLHVSETEKLFRWDGINPTEVALNYRNERSDLGVQQIPSDTANLLNLPAEQLRHVSFVPLGRGFFRPIYSLGKSKGHLTHAEREVSTLLADNRHIEYDISHRLEKILNKDFRVRNQIGSTDFSLDSIDRQSRIAASLVNEGFGVNQLVHLLATVLHPDAGIVCIEEPEIHLHPSAIRKLARELANIVRESGGKHLLISTHSKQFIMSLLALVAEGVYPPNALAVYMVTKDEKASEFHRQQVKENGQIEGGFASFIEGELEDMKVFLGV